MTILDELSMSDERVQELWEESQKTDSDLRRAWDNLHEEDQKKFLDKYKYVLRKNPLDCDNNSSYEIYYFKPPKVIFGMTFGKGKWKNVTRSMAYGLEIFEIIVREYTSKDAQRTINELALRDFHEFLIQ